MTLSVEGALSKNRDKENFKENKSTHDILFHTFAYLIEFQTIHLIILKIEKKV